MKTPKTILNPFKPGSGLFPPHLAGREEEISAFKSKLNSCIHGVPMHMAIIGDWGVGKTSLLSMMEKEATQKGLLVVSAISYPEDTKSFVANLIRRIDAEVKADSWIKGIKEFEFSLGFVKVKFDTAGEAQFSLQDSLTKIWKAINTKKKGILITIDDLDLIDNFKETMLLIRNTAMELSKKGCNIMFATAGAPTLFEKMHKAHAPLIRFFEPMVLERLEYKDAIDAIKVPLINTNMTYEEEIVSEIAKISSGHPYYLQEISHHVFEEAVECFDKVSFRKGYIRAFSDLSRDIFERKFNEISNNERKTVARLAESPDLKGFTEILTLVKLPKGSISVSLARLKQKGILSQKEKKYFIADRLFAEYVKNKLQH